MAVRLCRNVVRIKIKDPRVKSNGRRKNTHTSESLYKNIQISSIKDFFIPTLAWILNFNFFYYYKIQFTSIIKYENRLTKRYVFNQDVELVTNFVQVTYENINWVNTPSTNYRYLITFLFRNTILTAGNSLVLNLIWKLWEMSDSLLVNVLVNLKCRILGMHFLDFFDVFYHTY